MIRDISYVGEGLIPAPLHGPAKRYTPLLPGNVTDIAVHHMTGWNPPADATPEQEIRFLQGIDEYHRSSRGLDGIGYHIVAVASERVYIVSRLDRYGAGVGYENNHLLHLALPGDYTSQLPAPGHLEAAVVAVRHLYGYLGRDVPTTPHLYWGGTDCPGTRWREWVPQLREKAKEDDMLTDVQNKMIEAMHHQIVVEMPKNHKVILEKLGHLHAHVHDEIPKKFKALEDANAARFVALRDAATKRHQELQAQIDQQVKEILDTISAIDALGGPTANAIAAKIADELAKRLLE